MAYEQIIFDIKNEAAWVYLNRQAEMNSLSKALMGELLDVLAYIEHKPEIRAVVLSGKGRAFCAGADLKELLGDLESNPDDSKGLLDYAQELFNSLNSLSKPIVVALNGITLAGGLELAMTADVVIAAKTAKIGDGHANFGVLPGGGGAVRLPSKIGINRANYLLLTGDMLDANVWKEYGFVNEVVPEAELEDAVERVVSKITIKSPLVLKEIKNLVQAGLDQPLEASLNQELLTLKNHTQSYDFKEGLSAFSEKRKPEFKGY